MNDLLNVDLNALVTIAVRKQLEQLENDLSLTREKLRNSEEMVANLGKELYAVSKFSTIANSIRKAYAAIKRGPEDKYGNFDSVHKQRFYFIANLMKVLYRVETKLQWINVHNDGKLETYLAVAFYEHKENVISLLSILLDEPDHVIEFIRNFVMPYDYDKADIVEFVRNPHGCTNGVYFGVSQYWMEHGAGRKYTPYDLLMQSPYIVEDDVFQILVNTIISGKSNSRELLAVAEYNALITDDQIAVLGDCLPRFTGHWFEHKTVKSFIKNNILKFNNSALDFLCTKASTNEYSTVYWYNFPPEYQVKILRGMSFDSLSSALFKTYCTIPVEEKKALLREVLNDD